MNRDRSASGSANSSAMALMAMGSAKSATTSISPWPRPFSRAFSTSAASRGRKRSSAAGVKPFMMSWRSSVWRGGSWKKVSRDQFASISFDAASSPSSPIPANISLARCEEKRGFLVTASMSAPRVMMKAW